MLASLAKAGLTSDAAAIDNTYGNARRSARGGKWGENADHRPVSRWSNDQDPRPHRCAQLSRVKGIALDIPGKRQIRHDKCRYRKRWRVKANFCRLKDFRRLGIPYDELARNYTSAVALAAAIAFQC
ncbi:hypothetical protein MBLL_04209 [Methylobacterium bullatum]|uniref:Uncharacterized protein n=1 Tax=Methylobacterium bullatum TaxID=570505 RepID=A0A679KHJ8_9HYPH|nr:hypothetical protein MBLL_04209 [Methylobacterium bullatum]